MLPNIIQTGAFFAMSIKDPLPITAARGHHPYPAVVHQNPSVLPFLGPDSVHLAAWAAGGIQRTQGAESENSVGEMLLVVGRAFQQGSLGVRHL